MTLSQQSAQALMGAPAASYKIDAKWMVERGVGSLAPLATNVSDEGRAKNRRVELVLQ